MTAIVSDKTYIAELNNSGTHVYLLEETLDGMPLLSGIYKLQGVNILNGSNEIIGKLEERCV